MSAQVIDFAAARLARQSAQPPSGSPEADSGSAAQHAFTFWAGASGTSYVHTIYDLYDCPDLPNANVVLVHRHPSGRAEPLRVGRVEHDAPSLNLAEVRQSAASLGANEVHVHLLPQTASDRALVELDLSGAGELTSSSRAAQR